MKFREASGIKAWIEAVGLEAQVFGTPYKSCRIDCPYLLQHCSNECKKGPWP